MQLDPKHLTLNDLLLGRLFKIPEYQRAYAWGKKQRKDLFNDILEVQGTGHDHFMATVVCLFRSKRKILADEYQEVEIVDGQQRLTTLIILFKAIEKSLDATIGNQRKIKSEIADLLVKSDDFNLVLLQTNHSSSSVFVDYLQEGKHPQAAAPTEAEQNLVDAALECETFVEAWCQNNTLIELVALLRYRISLVYHQLADEASVYRIFEVLNSRGLDVKWIDKLKSQLMALIFMHAESGTRNDALKDMQNKWQEIYRTLGLRSELGDEALRFAGTWSVGSRPNRFLSEQDAAIKLMESAGLQLKSIVAVASWLRLVVNVSDRLDQDVRLRAVTRIVHARFLALAIMLRGLPKESEERLLKLWEKTTFRIFGLHGADSRHEVGEYIRLGYDVYVEKLNEKSIEERLVELGKGYSIDEVLKVVDWSDCYEGWSEELRYLLYRYDEFLVHNKGGKFNASEWNKIWHSDPSKSIEHILPQSTKNKIVHHLGNLTMLPPGVNSGLQAIKPKKKSETYRQCGLRGTAQVADQIDKAGGRWGRREILARSELLVKFVRKEWGD